MERKSNELLVQQLISEVYVNMYLLKSCIDLFNDKDFTYMMQRMQMQKELFVKELCRIFKIDGEDYHEQHKKAIQQTFKEAKSDIMKNDPALFYQLLNNRASSLLEIYYDLLFDKANSEIAKMILRNHIKEIKRDYRMLHDLMDNVAA